MKNVTIYLPTKTATQSGMGNNKQWILEFAKDETAYKSNLMLWNGSKDTSKQVCLKFNLRQEAINYAQKHGLNYKVLESAKHVLKKKSYSNNFIDN